MSNFTYHIIGAIFLIINCLRHKIVGYRTPRTFSKDDIKATIDYDFSVVNGWMKHYIDYKDGINLLKNKVVLELGPGPDLGTGAILLAMGAGKYIAIDVNSLATKISTDFIEQLLDRIRGAITGFDKSALRDQILEYCHDKNKSNTIKYIVDKNFDVTKISDKVDIIFSQAAFEHFDDFADVIKKLQNVVTAKCVMIAEIDLKTHTSWIRDRDPLNIYRYRNLFWNIFKFKGSPNRMRTNEYVAILKKYGWGNIQVKPLRLLERSYVEKIKPSLSSNFRNQSSEEMAMLSIMLMATKQ